MLHQYKARHQQNKTRDSPDRKNSKDPASTLIDSRGARSKGANQSSHERGRIDAKKEEEEVEKSKQARGDQWTAPAPTDRRVNLSDEHFHDCEEEEVNTTTLKSKKDGKKVKCVIV